MECGEKTIVMIDVIISVMDDARMMDDAVDDDVDDVDDVDDDVDDAITY